MSMIGEGGGSRRGTPGRPGPARAQHEARSDMDIEARTLTRTLLPRVLSSMIRLAKALCRRTTVHYN